MTRALLVAIPLFAAACTAEAPADTRQAPTTPVAFEALTGADGTLRIAAGGTAAVTLPDSVGLAGEASDGFAVEPAGDVWPNLRAPRYWIRAARVGTGSFAIQTNRGIASGLAHGAEVAQLAARPVGYQLDGHSPFALDARRPIVQVVLLDAGGDALVDASLGLVDAQATAAVQPAWDQLELAPAAGTHTLDVRADSLGARQLAVEVVDHIDRIETEQRGALTCYHAYAGGYEVAAVLDLAAPEPTAANCTRRADQSKLTTTGQ